MFIYVVAKEKENQSDRSFDYIEVNDEKYVLQSCFGAGVDIDGEAVGHFFFICKFKDIIFKVFTESYVNGNQIVEKYFVLDDDYSKLRNKYFN